MRKSRENQPLPKDFWANFVATVAQVYPDARLDRASIGDLYQLAEEEWRNGRQLHVIVREVCSCDGKKVYPSEGARQRLSRQPPLARAALDVAEGEVFGIDQLRDPAALARLKRRWAMLTAKIARAEEGLPILQARLATAVSRGKVERAQDLSESIRLAEWAVVNMRMEVERLTQLEREALASRRWSQPMSAMQTPTPRRAKPPKPPKPPKPLKAPKPPKPAKPAKIAKPAKPAKLAKPARLTDAKIYELFEQEELESKSAKPAKPAKPPKPPKPAKAAVSKTKQPLLSPSSQPPAAEGGLVPEDELADFINQIAKKA